MEIKAYGKINLTLEVLGTRLDGFHEIKSIMQSIDLYDEIILNEIDDGSIKLDGDSKELTYDENNLIFKAAEIMREKYGIKKGASIFLKKNIPVEAGLAGGSSDAASTLVGLNDLWSLNLSIDDLMKLGEEIGSDIPFTIVGGTALTEGRGEIVTKLKSLPEEEVLIVKPDFGVKTKVIYEEVDKHLNDFEPKYTSLMIEAINKGDDYKKHLHNDLAIATTKLYPGVKEILNKFKSEGCIGLMSGSGPTCYCFGDNASIKILYNYFKGKYRNTYLTTLKNL